MIETNWLVGFDDDLSDAFNIRRAVFMRELGMEEGDVFDGADGECFLLVAREGGRPVATGRVLIGGGECVISHVAVIAEERSKDIGDFVMRVIIRKAYEAGCKKQKVQTMGHAHGFFEKLGFRPGSGGGAVMIREGDVAGVC